MYLLNFKDEIANPSDEKLINWYEHYKVDPQNVNPTKDCASTELFLRI